jgi:hypothetical protein
MEHNNGEAPPETKFGRPPKITYDAVSFIEHNTIQNPMMTSRARAANFHLNSSLKNPSMNNDK